MKSNHVTILSFAVTLLMLPCGVGAGGWEEPYQEALDFALENGHAEVSSVLYAYVRPRKTLKSGISPLLAIALNSGRQFPSKVNSDLLVKEHLRLAELIVNGTQDPNLARVDGLTPLMAATKSGNAELATLLRKHGAKPFDPNDKKTKAILTKVSAELLQIALDEYLIENGVGKRRVDFDLLSNWWKGLGRSKELPPFIKDIQGDAYGNPIFIDIVDTEIVVKVSRDSIKEASDVVERIFWKEFYPSEDNETPAK